jgi:MOSC domain-containing protein YiiM
MSVSKSNEHGFSKSITSSITVIAGLGVAGDAHSGERVQHLSRVRADPSQPNLRQVHLIHAELFEELSEKGFEVGPADMGENITTRGIALLDLPRGTILRIGAEIELEVTGLRNPCGQIDAFQRGLLSAVIDRGSGGEIIRKAGIMSVVRCGGVAAPGCTIEIELPPEPHQPLERV